MTRRGCPLGCTATFVTTGDLDWHLRTVHRLRRLAAVWQSMLPAPYSPPRARRRPDLRVAAGFPGRRLAAPADLPAAADRQPARLQ